MTWVINARIRYGVCTETGACAAASRAVLSCPGKLLMRRGPALKDRKAAGIIAGWLAALQMEALAG
jgi:hypothetical protein